MHATYGALSPGPARCTGRAKDRGLCMHVSYGALSHGPTVAISAALSRRVLWQCARRDAQYHGNMTRFREHVWYHLRNLPLMVWRDSSVQHFDTASGDYVWPPRSNSCVPFRRVRPRAPRVSYIHLSLTFWVSMQPAARSQRPRFVFLKWQRPALPRSAGMHAVSEPACSRLWHCSDMGGARECACLPMRRSSWTRRTT
jgi:hypothetical protein